MRLPARPLLASCGLLMLTLAGCSGGDQPAEQPGSSPSGTASATSTPSASPSASASATASASASPTGEPTEDFEDSEDSSEAPGEDMDEAPDAPESDLEEPDEDSAGGYDAAEVANGSYGPGAEADENGYVGPSDAYYGYEGYVEPGFEYQVGSECFDAALGRCKTSGEIQAEYWEDQTLGEDVSDPGLPPIPESQEPGCFQDENGEGYCVDSFPFE